MEFFIMLMEVVFVTAFSNKPNTFRFFFLNQKWKIKLIMKSKDTIYFCIFYFKT